MAGCLKKHLIGKDVAEPGRSTASVAVKMHRFAGHAAADSLFARSA
jgi:hypothetical protein